MRRRRLRRACCVECCAFYGYVNSNQADYVSFSKKNADCSWYSTCNITTGIGNPTGDYESEVIKSVKGGPPVGTQGAVCCGVTSTGGDCNKDPRGSWDTGTGPAPPPAPSGLPANITAAVDWQNKLRMVRTSAQIETDVMPFLGRTPDGGDFNGYFNVSKGPRSSPCLCLPLPHPAPRAAAPAAG